MTAGSAVLGLETELGVRSGGGADKLPFPSPDHDIVSANNVSATISPGIFLIDGDSRPGTEDPVCNVI